MGNGLRGLRGVLEPSLFPQDDTRLSYASALMLSTNRYFNYQDVFTDNSRPALAISMSGSPTPLNGLLEINFTGSDSSGLSSAVLIREGDVIGQMALAGNSVNETFRTPYYEPAQAEEFEIRLYDSQGNRQTRSVTLTPASGRKRAPRPSISIDHSIVRIGQPFTLEASGSSDPDNSGGLTVEWDLDGDGTFDTPPSSGLNRLMSLTTPGTRQVYARLTDASGAFAVSSPIALRVLGHWGDADLDNDADSVDYDAWTGGFGRRTIPYYGADFNGNGSLDAADYVLWRKMPRVSLPRQAAGVPEPATSICACIVTSVLASRRRR
jgi:hypothetical protein